MGVAHIEVDRAAQAVAAVAQVGVGHRAQPGFERERMRGLRVEPAERGLERGLLVLGERALTAGSAA